LPKTNPGRAAKPFGAQLGSPAEAHVCGYIACSPHSVNGILAPLRESGVAARLAGADGEWPAEKALNRRFRRGWKGDCFPAALHLAFQRRVQPNVLPDAGFGANRVRGALRTQPGPRVATVVPGYRCSGDFGITSLDSSVSDSPLPSSEAAAPFLSRSYRYVRLIPNISAARTLFPPT